MVKIALMRHGRTAWNEAGRIQGRTDIPLTETERARLATLRLPDAWQGAEVLASPLARAAETARLISGVEPTLDDRLIEMDWGAWEGLHGADLRADPASGFRDIEEWGWAYTPPGGEGIGALRNRVLATVKSLDRDTIIVSHIGVMRVILASAHHWHFSGPCPFKIKRDRLYPLELDGGNLSVRGEAERLVQCA